MGRDCCTYVVILQVAEYMADRLCTRPDQDVSRDFLRLMCHPPDCSTILKVLQHNSVYRGCLSMSMYVCIHVHVLCVCMCVHMFLYVCAHENVGVYLHVCVCVHVHHC